MYDRRLDAIVAAAELGSFSKAAERLSISTPALVKQVTTFEREFGVVAFERTHTGVRPTAAGASLVEDARKIMGEVAAALWRARNPGWHCVGPPGGLAHGAWQKHSGALAAGPPSSCPTYSWRS